MMGDANSDAATVAGHVTGIASVTLGNGSNDLVTLAGTAKIDGTTTVTFGNGTDTATVAKGANLGTAATFNLGGTGVKVLNFDGVVGSGSGSNLNVNAGAGAAVTVNVQADAVVTGNATLNLTTDASNLVDYALGATITGTLIAHGNGAGTSTLNAHGHSNYMADNFTVVP
jgi:hypothetical protein